MTECIKNLHSIEECVVVLCSGSVHSELATVTIQKNLQIGRFRHEAFKHFCQVIR